MKIVEYSSVPEQVCHFITQHPAILNELRGASLFITGGTGFIGRWLLESLMNANIQLGLGLTATVLTRSITTFSAAHPRLAQYNSFVFIEGDVRNFALPKTATYSHIIHGAHTSATETFNREDPLTQFDTAYNGTLHVLKLAAQLGVKRLMMLSSGSVYGTLPAYLDSIPEDFGGAPSTQDIGSALNHGKRTAEFLCAYYREKFELETTIARCFSFIGPGLPLDIHYAIGNFIRDALWSDTILIKGNGSPIRSYMHVGDLINWLLVLLTQATSGTVYNVGSDEATTIAELAHRIRDILAPHKQVITLGKESLNNPRNRYVPDISKARTELGLDIWTPLDIAIRETAKFALDNQG